MISSSPWLATKLGDIIAIKHGWPFQSDLFSEELTGGPIIVSIGNFEYTGGFRFESTRTKEYRGQYPREYELTPGDILLVMTCQTAGGEILGIPGRVPNDGRTYLHNQRMGKVDLLRPDLVDLNYLYWLFLWKSFNQSLFNSASGTKILHTSPGRIEAFRFTLPPLSEQRAIARILGALDDKIELNRRQNATLEELARAIFKSWFVDFDPVRAKAAGRAPAAMDAATAALFPDAFEERDGREVPRGWLEATLARFALLNPETWTRETRPDILQYVDLSNTKWGRIEEIAVYQQQEVPSRAQRVLRQGDTIVGTVRPGNGSYALISDDGLTGSTGFAVLRPQARELTEFIYLAATAPENIERLSHLADGGAYPAVRPEIVVATPAVQPSEAILSRFSMVTKPLFAKVTQNERQSRTLAALRDALLPRLLSGELRVRDAERLVEERV